MRTTITDDEMLLRAVAEGDRAALRVLYERHAPWLTLRLTRRCPDPDLVDDAVQDTFVAVWRTASAALAPIRTGRPDGGRILVPMAAEVHLDSRVCPGHLGYCLPCEGAEDRLDAGESYPTVKPRGSGATMMFQRCDRNLMAVRSRMAECGRLASAGLIAALERRQPTGRQ